jgi:hypothetical protein
MSARPQARRTRCAIRLRAARGAQHAFQLRLAMYAHMEASPSAMLAQLVLYRPRGILKVFNTLSFECRASSRLRAACCSALKLQQPVLKLFVRFKGREML